MRDFKTFGRQAWSLTRPYFSSEERWRARGLLLAIVALNLGLVYMAVLFNDWNKLFYDALQEKQQAVFWEQLGRFSYLAVGFIVIAVYKFYLTQLLEMRWRAWMTRHYLQRWLSSHAFYHLELQRFSQQSNAGRGNPDNPDQRIQEDINQFTGYTVSLTMGLLNAVVTLASFVGILWGLSGGFAFTLGGSTYDIPGFMVWMALIYCVAGSVISHLIGRPQMQLNFEQQRREADFRHHMVRVREYSEAIALDQAEGVERVQLETRLKSVLGNYLALIRAQKNLVWFTSFFGQAAVVFPFVVAAPRFFSGAIQLGELMQISSAFGQVQGALSWFVDNYGSLAAWQATTERLASFEESISALSHVDKDYAATESVAFNAHDLQIGLPSGAVLLTGATLRAAAGDTILLQGPSGSGKSTLFRSIAGIWPFARGQIERPAEAMFIPQQPYFPNGPLREALAYPDLPQRYTDVQMRQALEEALLGHLVEQLDLAQAWGQALSGGEQQRLAIARVLLKQPRWVFADEATSALDENAEASVYRKLLALVAQRQGALVSIAHRPAVASFHQRRWVLKKQAQGAAAMYSISEEAGPGQATN
jgi:putative ATP-binding cassette transporter